MQTNAKRPMSEGEREALQKILKKLPSTITRYKRGAANALMTWAILTLLFVLVWMVIAWLTRKTLAIEIGWQAAWAVWVIVSGTFACALYSIISSVRWIKRWPDARKDYQTDLEGGQVIEESYEFTAAKRFQEPEHGGLFYFLRTTADKVFILWDYESQNLGVEGENPLNSKFRPMTRLLIARAPKSGQVLNKQFSGTMLETEKPQEISVSPEFWPEDESFCKIKWDDLEKRLGRKRK